MSKYYFTEMRAQEVADLMDKAEGGDINPLELYAEIKDYNNFITDAIKQLEPLALSESLNFPEKTFECNGYEITKRDGSTLWSYKNIPLWNELKDKLKLVEEQSKQAFLSRQKGLLIANEDGEEIIFPEISYSKSGLVVKKLQITQHI